MAAPESNPYAPPKAVVADRESDASGLKYRSVWVMVVFMIITLGVYYLFWFFRRRAGLNRLDSPRKLPLWPLLLMSMLFVVQFALGLISAGEPLPLVIGEAPTLLLSVAQFVVGIVMIFQCFWIREIIQDHASPESSEGLLTERVELSGVMTFFFSILYLQWAINKYIVKA